MRILATLAGFLTILCAGTLPEAAHAQAAVVAASDVDALFTDRNPKLNANKQVAYHIMKDLLEAGHWDEADRYLTEAYTQHNPNVASGRDTVVKFFKGLGVTAKPIPARLSSPVVQVVAQGDFVVVVTVATLPTPSNPAKTYTTSWFDMWRIKDGKADEHWDSATLMR
ncbi:MAG: nuclear transport factor 2 family protein [Sphingomicrobium sp.]